MSKIEILKAATECIIQLKKSAKDKNRAGAQSAVICSNIQQQAQTVVQPVQRMGFQSRPDMLAQTNNIPVDMSQFDCRSGQTQWMYNNTTQQTNFYHGGDQSYLTDNSQHQTWSNFSQTGSHSQMGVSGPVQSLSALIPSIGNPPDLNGLQSSNPSIVLPDQAPNFSASSDDSNSLDACISALTSSIDNTPELPRLQLDNPSIVLPDQASNFSDSSSDSNSLDACISALISFIDNTPELSRLQLDNPSIVLPDQTPKPATSSNDSNGLQKPISNVSSTFAASIDDCNINTSTSYDSFMFVSNSGSDNHQMPKATDSCTSPSSSGSDGHQTHKAIASCSFASSSDGCGLQMPVQYVSCTFDSRSSNNGLQNASVPVADLRRVSSISTMQVAAQIPQNVSRKWPKPSSY